MSAVDDKHREEVYTKIAEEAGEIVQAVCKLLQHGESSRHPDKPRPWDDDNRIHLSKELGDMLGLIKWAVENNILHVSALQEAAESKMRRVGKYAHHIPVTLGYTPVAVL